MYYAVSGSNAFGVYSDKNRISNVSPYIRNMQVVNCKYLDTAYSIARDDFNDYQLGGNIEDIVDWPSTSIRLNRVYFLREVREVNLRNESQ